MWETIRGTTNPEWLTEGEIVYDESQRSIPRRKMFLAEDVACVKVWRWALVLCKIGLLLSTWSRRDKVEEEGKH